MKASYFKHRRPFALRAHPYDIGSPFGHWKGYDDNHFLRKLYHMPAYDYSPYYSYHLNHALEMGVVKDGLAFLAYVRKIVDDRIRYLEAQDPFSLKHGRYRKYLNQLSQFRNYLHTLEDVPDYALLVARLETQLQQLKDELAEKDQYIQQLAQFDTKNKIRITKGYIRTVIDLVQQLSEIRLPDKETYLIRASTETVWIKMLCKYFQHGDDEIKMETIRRYFTANKENPGVKYSPIHDKDKLFQILPANRAISQR